MMKFNDKTLNSRVDYQGKLMHVELRELENENGLKYQREIVRRVNAVAVVAVNDGKIILVKQFRSPVDKPLLELPAGIMEEVGPEKTANKELIEEAGYKARKLELMTKIYTSAGYSDEEVYIYKATELESCDPEPEEEEVIEIIEMPIEEAVELCKSGEIKDAKTIIGILLLSSEC